MENFGGMNALLKEDEFVSKNIDIGNNFSDLKTEIKDEVMDDSSLTEEALKIDNKSPNVCSYCNKAFSFKSTLIDHMNVHTGVKPYQCRHCDKAFSFHIQLIAHRKTHSLYGCNQCEKLFESNHHLQNHKKIHTQKIPYPCRQCNKSFSSSYFLKKHERIHTNGSSYPCNKCNMVFSSHYTLTSHKKIHAAISKTNPVVKLHQYSQGEKFFKSHDYLENHMKTHSQEISQHCSPCNENSSKKYSLKKYEIEHCKGKSDPCNNDKSFLEEGRVNNIIINKKPHKCGKCDEAFPTMHTLVIHKKVHSGRKVHQCTQCNNSYLSESFLQRHVSNNHTKDKTFLCTKCDMSFSFKIQLINHMSIHTENRNHQGRKHEQGKFCSHKDVPVNNLELCNSVKEKSTTVEVESENKNPRKENTCEPNDLYESNLCAREIMKNDDSNDLKFFDKLKVEVKEEAMDNSYDEIDKLPEPKIEIK